MTDRFYQWLASIMPRRLVYFAVIQATAKGLEAKIEIDKITMDNFLGQLADKDRQIEKLNRVYEAGKDLTYADAVSGAEGWKPFANAIKAVEGE